MGNPINFHKYFSDFQQSEFPTIPPIPSFITFRRICFKQQKKGKIRFSVILDNIKIYTKLPNTSCEILIFYILKNFATSNFREPTFSGVIKDFIFATRNFLPAKMSSFKVHSHQNLACYQRQSNFQKKKFPLILQFWVEKTNCEN